MGIAYGTTTLHQATKGIVQDGLFLNLDAGVRDAISGDTWYDISGNNHYLTLLNSPTITTERGGNVVLDGTDDNATPSSNIKNAVNGGTEISYCFWFKGDNAKGSQSIMRQQGSGGYIVPLYYYGSNSGKFLMSTNGSGPSAGTSHHDGNWHYMCCVYKKGEVWAIYKDGSVIASNTNYTHDLPNLASAGRFFSYSTNSEKSVGSVPVMHLYTKALTASEVLQNFNVTRHRFGI